MADRPELLFVSPRFLFPADTGGAIRTTEILRNLRGRAFHVRLLSPARGDEQHRFAQALSEIADVAEFWPAVPGRGSLPLWGLPLLASSLPVSVAADRSGAALRAVAAALSQRPEVVVFDFLHAAVFAPPAIAAPTVLFTHNVETEIFERNRQHARTPWHKWVWGHQCEKMRRFESAALRRFDRIIAVSERDAARLREDFGGQHVDVIPTGVNLDYFGYHAPESNDRVVFTGSMDWLANIDAMRWFGREIWPQIKAERPAATMTVVGRNPPTDLLKGAPSDWTFTGRVDDIRPHVRSAAAYVIPLRIGGGTRIKAFEAMAMGLPVVSTSIGIEGLDVCADRHYLRADDHESFAGAVVRVLADADARRGLAQRARQHVDTHFSNAAVAQVFEAICMKAISMRP